MGAYITVSEVLAPLCLKVPHLTSRSDFHFKSTSLFNLAPPPLLSPAHSHPPCYTDEASFWWKCSAVICREEPASSIYQQRLLRAQWINYI